MTRALLWIEKPAPAVMPTMSVPAAMFYAAETTAILLAGATDSTVVDVQATLVSRLLCVLTSRWHLPCRPGRVVGLNTNAVDASCPLIKHASMSVVAAWEMVAIIDCLVRRLCPLPFSLFFLFFFF